MRCCRQKSKKHFRYARLTKGQRPKCNRGFEERVEVGQFHKIGSRGNIVYVSADLSTCAFGVTETPETETNANTHCNSASNLVYLLYFVFFFLASRCENVVHFLYRWISVSVLFLFFVVSPWVILHLVLHKSQNIFKLKQQKKTKKRTLF